MDVKKCKYCREPVGKLYLICNECDKFVHVKCLKSGGTPGGLSGDIFFIFTCRFCNENGNESFVRAKMTWVDIVLLVMYNLTQNHRDSSKMNCYFHRDLHISDFLNKNWSSIFPHMRTKRRTWRQMLSDTLRKHPQYFKYTQTKKDAKNNIVWYKLAHPKLLPNQAHNERNQKKSGPRDLDAELSDAYESGGEGPSIAVDQLNTVSLNSENNMYSMSYVKPSVQLAEFLIAGEDESGIPGDNDVDIEEVDSMSPLDFNNYPMDLDQDLSEPTDETFFEETKPDVEKIGKPATVTTTLPWLTGKHIPVSNCKPMNEGEEAYRLSALRKRIQQSELMSVAELRLYRKLVVRKLRRERQMGVFNLDAGVGNEGKENVSRVLDRFRHRTVATDPHAENTSFWTRLMGTSNHYTCFTSPMTKRTLKAYIRQDFESRPLWLKLCAEIRQRRGGSPEPISPIVYTYVRPQHIPAVNSLAEQFFWPGINLSECLHYPDYSCVVLYKKLVVGFAFLVPDVRYNEAYISFILTRPEWRRAGIATFMLYHLIQTCLGKDITLHVSVTNPALFLYQKFGFKVEEFIQDFYDKYLPAESSECRHALFLRLAR